MYKKCVGGRGSPKTALSWILGEVTGKGKEDNGKGREGGESKGEEKGRKGTRRRRTGVARNLFWGGIIFNTDCVSQYLIRD